MNKICVLGSINMDVVFNVKAMPKIGETILAEDVKKYPGGKGANQAVAAARLGADIHMVGKVGNDENGKILVDNLKENNVNADNIIISKDYQTGMAAINVDEEGNNSIIVASGANMKINKEEIVKNEALIKSSRFIISQFEVPVEAIIEAFKIAKDNNVITILNPAPAKEIPEELLKLTDIIIPNETEIEVITKCKVYDLETAKKASAYFLKYNVKYVITTLGSKGAAVVNNNKALICPPIKVKAVDTTAAGDSFIGAFAVKLTEYEDIEFENIYDAVNYGNKVASITVQRKGAQPSLPYKNEII